MYTRSRAVSRARTLAASAAIALAVVAAACGDSEDDDTTTAPSTSAQVRFVNLTGSNIDVVKNGTVVSGFGNLAFGATTGCTSVTAASPNVVVRNTGGAPISTFAPTLTGGGRYTIVAYRGSDGTTQFLTLNDLNTPPVTAEASMRVVNLASGTGPFDVYVTTPNAALGTTSATNLAFATSAPFFNVPSGFRQVRLTGTGTTTVGFDLPSQMFQAGTTSTVFVGPAATGSTTLRSVVVPAC
jgi:hypothetical protein